MSSKNPEAQVTGTIAMLNSLLEDIEQAREYQKWVRDGSRGQRVGPPTEALCYANPGVLIRIENFAKHLLHDLTERPMPYVVENDLKYLIELTNKLPLSPTDRHCVADINARYFKENSEI